MSNNTTGGPDFVKKLFKMLEDESYNDIVAWGVNGDSFVVKEIDAFTKTILPRHFKHSNFASFVRQLNKYDFHKIRNSDDVNAPYGEQAWEFRHPKFQCNKRDQLDNIKRKTPAGRKAATNTPQNNEAPANSHLSDLQSQVNTLNKLQNNMNNHLHTLSNNYQTVVQDIMNFQKNLIAQDQLMQNLVQYLVNQEAEKAGASNFLHRSSTGFGADNSVSFIPSEQAQKLIDSYTEVARASFEQMNEISRRAQQPFSQFVNSDKPSSSQSLTTPNPPITPPPDQTLDLGSQPINANNAGKASSLQKLQSNRNSIPSQQTSTNALSSTAMSSNHTLNSSSTLKAPDTYSQNATGLGLNPQLTDNNGLTVFTLGHLAPKQTQMTSNNTSMTQPSNSSSQIPNTLTQRGSNTMRVHRTTFVPAWSMPPKVLLVEDDEVYQNIGTKFLQVFGCTIDIAMDGVTAVNKMNLAKYDLVLMDIVLPNLDGVEATTQIRRFDPNTPIISMTSNTTKLDCIKYMTHGMNDVLAKPFTKNKLLAMLERYCMHLKVLPNFQEIPRPLGTPDGSLVPSNQLTTTAINNLSNPPNNVREWIPSQLIQNDFTYASSTNQLDTIGSDYMSMVHIMGMSTSGQPTGTVRFADDLYGNTDPRSCRENKRAKFEVLDD